MIFIAIYLIAGVLAYYWLSKKTKEGYSEAVSTMFLEELPGLILCIGFWPIMIPLFLNVGRMLDKEKKEIENRKEYIPEDLSQLKGKFGETITPQAPSGKVKIEGKEYESRSALSYIKEGQRVQVVGHSMHHLQIEPAEPVRIGNG